MHIHVDIKTHHISSSFLPCFLPSCLSSFLPSDITACRLLSCLAIQQGHKSFWSWRYFQENAQVFSYWKKLDLIRDLKTSFICPWSLWIWLPLRCHCKIKAKIRMFVKKTFLQFYFFIDKAAWMAQHGFRYWGYIAVGSILLILSSQREPGLESIIPFWYWSREFSWGWPLHLLEAPQNHSGLNLWS